MLAASEPVPHPGAGFLVGRGFQACACKLCERRIVISFFVYVQMCTDGSNCKRRVCFFAHTESELRKPEEDPLWLQQQLQAELAAGAAGEALWPCGVKGDAGGCVQGCETPRCGGGNMGGGGGEGQAPPRQRAHYRVG